MLGLRSYLLDEASRENEPHPPPHLPHQLGAAHRALIWRDGPAGFEPYVHVSWFVFPLRLGALLALVSVSLVLASALTLVIPVAIGRKVMTIWLPKASEGVHELYTAAYVCVLGGWSRWCVGRWVGLRWSCCTTGSCGTMDQAGVTLGTSGTGAAGISAAHVRTAAGTVIPLRVPLEQSPVLFVLQDWALGVLYTKIVCALIMMGSDWSLRRAIEKAYRDGIREMDLQFILRSVAAPLVRWLGLALVVPYVLAHSVAPLVLSAHAQRNLLVRRVYPALLLIALLAALALFQIRQFTKLYEHIKNDKYLVGQRLVNYDHRRHKHTVTSNC
ncbi:unnamed protein product [Danaus chrysippus]|uniref:RING-type E3 ubiquitin transferase n=1 Tax=Danaus chrysippus TaxID=151541 RepID=A0A8J2QEB6_9NEOP|nr:unnamed protein product [Danaus chrysippus]